MNTKTITEGIKLKVLVLEDSPRDLELMREQLSNAGYHLGLTHVENEAGFTASLRENSFDLILSDFKLPGLDGFGALKISRELCPETPFICVSGAIGEETAVELLKQGAVDYVLKDKPEKLPLAVRRALEEAKVKADYQKAEKELREQEEMLSAIYRNAPLIIMVVNAERRVQQINGFATKFAGRDAEEMLGLRGGEALRCLHVLDDPEGCGFGEFCQQCVIRNTVLDTLETGETHLQVEAPYFFKGNDDEIKGMTLLTSTTNIMVKGERMVLVTFQDITERKKIVEALRLSEEMMRNSQSVAHICSYSTNLVVNEIEKSNWVCSPEFYKIFGIDETYPHTIEGWTAFIHPDYREEVFAYHESVVKEKKSFNHEYKIIRINDGAERWVHGTGELEYDDKGKPVRMHGAIQDITDRKRVEKVLLESEDRFKKLSSFTFEGIIIHNNGIAIDINQSAVEMLGYERDEITGRNLFELIHPDYHALVKENLVKRIATPYQIVAIRKNGSTFDAEVEARDISYNDEYFRVACIRDITERKKMLEELIAAKEKAEESDRLKTAFLHNISHEIRTPLNGILGFGTLLSEKDYSPEAKKEMLAVMQQSSSRLLKTLTDYMDMARIISGTMELHMKEFSLQPLIEETIKEAKYLCEEKKIGLKTVIPKQCGGIYLFSDRELIRKTINFLLDNSLKFISKGDIIFGFRVIPEFLEFYVQDTGIGIADDKLEMIFDMFSQEDSSNTRGYEGSGLGLSIARGWVNLLGGSIFVSSEKGMGSTFTFTVPYKETKAAEKTAQAEEKSRITPGKPLVLLAEDDESNYLYMQEVLQQAGCDYLLAKNGVEALELCKQQSDITLLLMDIKMPVMDGVEATRRIREFRPEVPIIATTAYAQTGDEERFLAAGCTGYLAKPINKEKLLGLLSKY